MKNTGAYALSYILLFLLAVALLITMPILFFACAEPAQVVPESGIWFCEELQITVDFGTGDCSALMGENIVHCELGNHRGSKYFSVVIADVSSEEFEIGETVFSGECIYYDAERMVVKDGKTGTEYTFYKKI